MRAWKIESHDNSFLLAHRGRAFYDENDWKILEIHTDNHGNAKNHPYGERGEHIHYYEWNKDGSLDAKYDRELTETERRENKDIL